MNCAYWCLCRRLPTHVLQAFKVLVPQSIAKAFHLEAVQLRICGPAMRMQWPAHPHIVRCACVVAQCGLRRVHWMLARPTKCCTKHAVRVFKHTQARTRRQRCTICNRCTSAALLNHTQEQKTCAGAASMHTRPWPFALCTLPFTLHPLTLTQASDPQLLCLILSVLGTPCFILVLGNPGAANTVNYVLPGGL